LNISLDVTIEHLTERPLLASITSDRFHNHDHPADQDAYGVLETIKEGLLKLIKQHFLRMF
jgi:hypothetical protein